MTCDHFGSEDPRNSWVLPGPFFEAGYAGECSRGGEDFEPGTTIRADGDGGYECHECVTQGRAKGDRKIMSEGNTLRIEQGGSEARVWLNGAEITNALRGLTLDMDAMVRRTTVHLNLSVDVIEITALGEQDRTLLVSIPSEAEEALQAIGWIKTSGRTTFTAPREEDDL